MCMSTLHSLLVALRYCSIEGTSDYTMYGEHNKEPKAQDGSQQ